MNVDFQGLVIGALVALWVGTVAVAWKLQQKQTQVQMKLQDREVEWSLYVHLLRRDFVEAAGKEPRRMPEKLLPFPYDDPHIDQQ